MLKVKTESLFWELIIGFEEFELNKEIIQLF